MRNQVLLGLSCVWTLSVVDPTTDPTFFATTLADFSPPSLLLGIICAAPLVAGGLAISRSESRLWVDINASTSQLALKLFGGRKALAQVAVSSALLGLVTGAAEELSFRGLGMPLTADRIGFDMASTAGQGAALALSALTFGLGHWSWGGGLRENAVTVALQSCTGMYLGGTFLAAGGNVVVPAVAHAVYDAFTLVEAHLSTANQIAYAKDKSGAAQETLAGGDGQVLSFFRACILATCIYTYVRPYIHASYIRAHTHTHTHTHTHMRTYTHTFTE